MLPEHKKNAADALRRLAGLVARLQRMIEEDEQCPRVLENLLAVQGHVRHVQGEVLESHLQTCVRKKIASESDYRAFVSEIVRTIGLSSR